MSTISAGTTTTTGYVVTSDTTGALVLKTGASGTTALTIDTSQNVGIGTASPIGVANYQGITIGGTTGGLIRFQSGASTQNAQIAANTSGLEIECVNTGIPIKFYTGGSERCRIDSSGRLLVGTTSSIGTATVGRLQVLGGETFVTTNSEAGGFVGVNSNADNSLALVADVDNLRSGSHIAFYVDGFSEKARIDSSGNLLLGLSSALANGKLQVAGSIGLSGNTQIRQATNGDGNTLQLFATQVVVGPLNSLSYGYSGGGLLASVSNAASAITLDTGGNTAGHRLQIINDGSGSTGTLNYSNAGTSRFYVNSSTGFVGIGTASPARLLQVGSANGEIRLGGAAGLEITHDNSGTTVGEIKQLYAATSASAQLKITSGFTTFQTGTSGTERARFTSAGDFDLYITPAKDGQLRWTSGAGGAVQAFIYANGNPELIAQTGGSGGVKLTSGATSWVSASDIRNKNIIEPITNAVAKIATLSSVIYSFKDDAENTRRAGLVAQELLEVLPEAVYVPAKEDELLGVRYSEVTPLLVAAIKEQQAIIESLTQRIAALEGQ